MVVDEVAAAVVRRVFAMYLEGWGRKAIAEQLNRESVPCPSAHTPEQNRHRIMDGWQHSTIAAVLENPRYTGYAIYGRWQKVEELVDPDDVDAGYVVKFRRSPQAKIVRSRRPTHPEIGSVEVFTAAELEKRRCRVGGAKGWSSGPRRRSPSRRVYVLRGRIKCSMCSRNMEGAARHAETLYHRCNARKLVPGSAAALAHPRQIYLREDVVVPALNRWVGTLFDPAHREATIEALLIDAEGEDGRAAYVEELCGRVRAAKVTMDRARKRSKRGGIRPNCGISTTR
ncbi:recombinase family protein [Kribbella amoyensis]|uniref:recombinase family protein n=1 Tax=Kribbella amoyensis TaxID=996641 RepID=UPI0014783B4C|nr:recombinase family protein [Kribbella amoyensis]